MRFLAPLAAGAYVAGLAMAQTTSTQEKPAAAPRPTAKAVAPAPDPRKMDRLLAEWEAQSAQTTSMVAEFVRTDVDTVWNSTTKYTGQAILKSPNYACLEFRKIVDPKQPPKFHERIICSGDKVYQFTNDSKQIFVYPLDPNERQRALEEGPLPFLFNMKAIDARHRYEMTLANERPDQYLIKIVPLQQVDREAFSIAWVWLDGKTFLPKRLDLINPENGKDKKSFTFTKIARNANVDMANFDGEKVARIMVAKKWDLVENPGPDARQPSSVAPRPSAVRPAAKAQPAQRPRTGRVPG
jgi:TIGR03009 family protein